MGKARCLFWFGYNALIFAQVQALRQLDHQEGAVFHDASTFRCDACEGELRLTYSDKVALFAKHAHLA
jgi:hypothetical protein